ncbi:MAG: MaoC family dehydratase N-terminal domain-containing protein [Chloroflexi bacterium]|nr:MaoC family dehydratase N-terminal domain-containing protein [Chloroflexota bacterium]
MSTAAIITDEALAALRARIGVEVRRPQPHVEVATRDAIRHFADGTGDANPLWRDAVYSARTRWGTVLAPPCMLYAFDRVVSGQVGGLPGIHALFAGTAWEWYEPLREGDHVVGHSALHALEEKRSAFSGRSVKQTYRTRFVRQSDGVLVAQADSWCIRTERDTARERGKYQAIEPHRYTAEELAAIEAAIDAEEVRGGRPRSWEDVRAGDELPPVVKGPATVTDFIAWLIGWGGLFVRAHRLALAFRREHPAAAIPNEQSVPDVPERVHWDSAFARKIGAPAAYDYGPQRIAWLGNLLTSWMGDDGFLRRLDVQVRMFNIVGDTSWCRGRVSRVYVADERHLADCDVWVENQRGETTAVGTATVELPWRG